MWNVWERKGAHTPYRDLFEKLEDRDGFKVQVSADMIMLKLIFKT